jgi:CRP/FNR family cyclic AMP-dependent transcriptional regulator
LTNTSDDGWPVAGSFLAALDADERQVLLQGSTRRPFAAHTTLFHQGDPSTHVLVMLVGWVKAFATSRTGYEALLAIRGPGDIIGELSALDGKVRSATVLTLSPVEVAVLPSEQFVALLGRQPQLALALFGYLADRLREADRRRLEFGALSVSERLIRRLLELAELHGKPESGGIVLDIPLSQRELAGSVGASREAVARALKLLRERRIVITQRQRIVVLQPQVLRSIAGSTTPQHP